MLQTHPCRQLIGPSDSKTAEHPDEGSASTSLADNRNFAGFSSLLPSKLSGNPRHRDVYSLGARAPCAKTDVACIYSHLVQPKSPPQAGTLQGGHARTGHIARLGKKHLPVVQRINKEIAVTEVPNISRTVSHILMSCREQHTG